MKKLAGKFLLFFFSLAAALLVAEIGFRILGIKYPAPRKETWHEALIPPGEREPALGVQFAPHSRFKISYNSNPTGYFDDDNSVSYRINNFGFRGDDLQLEKRPGWKRILILGDSFTMGDGVKEEHTYPKQLEIELRKTNPNVEVLNFGISGWNTKNELYFLRKTGLKFQPDLVIIGYVLNDAVYPNGPPKELRSRYTLKTPWIKKSYFLDYLYQAISRYLISREYIRLLIDSPEKQKGEWGRSLRALADAHTVATKSGSNFMVVVWPFLYNLDREYPMASLHELIKTHSQKHNIHHLDLLQTFRGLQSSELWVHPTDQHPNSRTHQMAAEALAQFIRRNNLL